ncbi:MAG: methylated-DNA--[protein]-cysteine S-methyltransferase [Chloroflexi bacterium]|nr:methylated-DNA--[protein]-cysteine S-methyltransferase [Chloroflexota bacterium]
MLTLGILEIDWGWLGIAHSERGLCGLTLPMPTAEEAMLAIAAEFPTGLPQGMAERCELTAQLQRFFVGEPVAFSVTLDLPERPPFWRRVWAVVAEIPYGATMSYGEVAIEVGAPRAARAVGGAMANNPVPIIIPCHRVVGSGGKLTGFGGGLEMKRRLIEMERRGTSCVNAATPTRPSDG